MSNIVPLSDITQMAEVAASSKMFGFKNPQEAMAIMLLCQAENFSSQAEHLVSHA